MNTTLHSARWPRNPCNEAREEQQRRRLREEAASQSPSVPSMCHWLFPAKLDSERSNGRNCLTYSSFPQPLSFHIGWLTRRHARGHLHICVFFFLLLLPNRPSTLLPQQMPHCDLGSLELFYFTTSQEARVSAQLTHLSIGSKLWQRPSQYEESKHHQVRDQTEVISTWNPTLHTATSI